MATTTTQQQQQPEGNKGLRNFKQSSDVENFYRFVFENSFRREAHYMLDLVRQAAKKANKKKRRSKQKIQ